MSKLADQYKQVCESYIKKFVEKQGYEFYGWITDEDLGVADFIDEYFINFSDMKYDIDHKIEKGLIFKWCDDSLENYQAKQEFPAVNYKSYCMGARFKK